MEKEEQMEFSKAELKRMGVKNFGAFKRLVSTLRPKIKTREQWVPDESRRYKVLPDGGKLAKINEDFIPGGILKWGKGKPHRLFVPTGAIIGLNPCSPKEEYLSRTDGLGCNGDYSYNDGIEKGIYYEGRNLDSTEKRYRNVSNVFDIVASEKQVQSGTAWFWNMNSDGMCLHGPITEASLATLEQVLTLKCLRYGWDPRGKRIYTRDPQDIQELGDLTVKLEEEIPVIALRHELPFVGQSNGGYKINPATYEDLAEVFPSLLGRVAKNLAVIRASPADE